MAYDERLAERIRELMAPMPGMSERKMFGGIAFMINGNMACGPVDDRLMVRVGPEGYEDALQQPGASELSFTGRPMRGMVEVEPATLEDQVALATWVARGVDFAASLPPK